MDTDTKIRYLKLSLATFGGIFLLIYPLGVVWPAGWVWHGGDGYYYLHMIIGVYAVLGIYLIRAAANPLENLSLIWFTVWSSVAHAVVMGFYGIKDGNEMGHLIGDVPALFVVAIVFGYLASGLEPSRKTAAA